MIRKRPPNLRPRLALALLLLAVAPGLAAERRTTFRTEPESAWNKRSGDFHVWLSVSTEARAFIAAWEDQSKGLPELRESRSFTVIPREVEFGAFLLFSHCPLSPRKTCDARVTLQILSPEGKVLVEQANLPLWSWAVREGDGIYLSECVWYTSAEASDPPGDYRLRAIVADPTSGKQIVLARVVRHT